MRTHALCLATMLLLAACASTPPAGKPAEKRGGYYLNDGPGQPPADNVLAQVAEPRPVVEPLHKGAMKPYEVLGRRYVPLTELRPYKARGQATFYGSRYNGRPTSTGEPYRMYDAMTAAHTTLPLPSYVRVTNLDNGRSVIVRLNDRGPFINPNKRIIDLSYVAAWKLGFVDKGSANVEVEQILPQQYAYTATSATTTPAAQGESPQPYQETQPLLAAPLPDLPAVAAPQTSGDQTVSEAATATWLQLGAFGDRGRAEALARQLAGHYQGRVRPQVHEGGGLYRLRLGPFSDTDAARRALDEGVRPLGLDGFVTR